MPNLNAQEVAASWSRSMNANIQKIKDGVNAVTESPMAKAAARVDAYVAGVQRAAENGKYVDGLLSTSLEEWKRITSEKVGTRLAGGVKEAMPKVVQFLTQLLPYTAQVSREVQAMPKGDIQMSAARMLRNMELMSQFKFRKRK